MPAPEQAADQGKPIWSFTLNIFVNFGTNIRDQQAIDFAGLSFCPETYPI
jgi:hypothetical protein